MDRTTLLKNDWLNELKTTRNNREGIGMYTLDTFDEELASGLAECSKKIMVATLETVCELCDNSEITSKEDLKSIIIGTILEIKENKDIEGYEDNLYDFEQ